MSNFGLNCGDPVAMQNYEVIKQRANARQNLKVWAECLQYFAHQGVAFCGNNRKQNYDIGRGGRVNERGWLKLEFTSATRKS